MAREVDWSKFSLLMVEAVGHEMNLLDDFLRRSKETLRGEKKKLEQRIESGEAPEDVYIDCPILEDLAWLSSEFAIIGLWRCVELFRYKAIKHALGPGLSDEEFIEAVKCLLERNPNRYLSFTHPVFMDVLAKWEITEEDIRCAESVKELRLLNNAIKHRRQVTASLSTFPTWERGKELGDLGSHYNRLQCCAEQYIEDLARRLEAKFLTLG